MKTLFKSAMLIVAAIIATLSFTSCSSDDEPAVTDNPLVGTWEHVYDDDLDDMYIERVIFKNKGQCELQELTLTGELVESAPGTYTYDYTSHSAVITYVTRYNETLSDYIKMVDDNTICVYFDEADSYDYEYYYRVN